MSVVTGLAFGGFVSIPRTGDTSTYAGGDVIGIDAAGSPGSAVLTFPNIGSSTRAEVMFTTVSLEIDATAIPSGMTSFRLHLYSASPPSALVDNNAWDLPSGDRPFYLGYLDLGTPVDVGSTLYVLTSQVNTQFTMPGTASGALYGYLVTNGGFTPASGTVFKPWLHSMGL